MKAKFPHCDQNVLHAPGACVYCDKYPEAQMKRIEDYINFTGGDDPNASPCPSLRYRALEVIERWPGNRSHSQIEKNVIDIIDDIEKNT